jgi:hypothetical protein
MTCQPKPTRVHTVIVDVYGEKGYTTARTNGRAARKDTCTAENTQAPDAHDRERGETDDRARVTARDCGQPLQEWGQG